MEAPGEIMSDEGLSPTGAGDFVERWRRFAC